MIETKTVTPDRIHAGTNLEQQIDVGPWNTPDVVRSVHAEQTLKTTGQIQREITQERQAHLFDPHGRAINQLGATALPGRRSSGEYDDLKVPSGKEPRYRAERPEV